MRKTTKKQESNGTTKPTTTCKSEMLRVDIGFATWARECAERDGLTLAEFTGTLPDIVDEDILGQYDQAVND